MVPPAKTYRFVFCTVIYNVLATYSRILGSQILQCFGHSFGDFNTKGDTIYRHTYLESPQYVASICSLNIYVFLQWSKYHTWHEKQWGKNNEENVWSSQDKFAFFFLSYLLVLLQRVFILVSELQTPKRLKEALVSAPKPNKLGKPMY